MRNKDIDSAEFKKYFDALVEKEKNSLIGGIFETVKSFTSEIDKQTYWDFEMYSKKFKSDIDFEAEFLDGISGDDLEGNRIPSPIERAYELSQNNGRHEVLRKLQPYSEPYKERNEEDYFLKLVVSGIAHYEAEQKGKGQRERMLPKKDPTKWTPLTNILRLWYEKECPRYLTPEQVNTIVPHDTTKRQIGNKYYKLNGCYSFQPDNTLNTAKTFYKSYKQLIIHFDAIGNERACAVVKNHCKVITNIFPGKFPTCE